MNDRAVGLLESYDIEVLRTRKGRSAILCDTDKGCLILKEYTGNPEKIKVQEKLLEKISVSNTVPVEQILKTKEEELLAEDTDGKKYVLKTYFESRECNVKDIEECKEAVRTLAKLHEVMCLPEEKGLTDGMTVFSAGKEFDKHNRELKKVWRYLRNKGQKSSFENTLLGKYDYYLEQALEMTSQFEEFTREDDLEYIREQGMFCHGDYQYHNIIRTGQVFSVINFERCLMDNPIRDLYLFMRKLLEKSNWSEKLGSDLLDAYNNVRPLSARSFVELYYRLAYPEKFWKIVNFYYNSGKAWIPEKNREKLEILAGQEKEKQTFLDTVFRTIHR
ncbi:MAG: CotS family spore coat protein [Lachnospiraceae bacterium]|nr:CotS family spore coat protein [Lachnospiraceae bacterium]